MRTPFTLLPVLALALLCSASPQTMADDALRACLRGKVQITTAAVVQTESTFGGADLRLSIKNNLSWPISLVRISYTVYSEGRAVPWSEDTFIEAIPGGIEPGETRELTKGLALPFDAPDVLTVKTVVLDVADANKRRLVGGTEMQQTVGQLLDVESDVLSPPMGCK